MSRADASPWGQETPSTGHAVPPEKHQCSRCPSSFKRPEHLKRHQRGHDGHKRFVCPTCSKRFARSDILSRHEAMHLALERSSNAAGRKRACAECAKARDRCSRDEPCVRCSTKALKCIYPDDATPRTAVSESLASDVSGPDRSIERATLPSVPRHAALPKNADSVVPAIMSRSHLNDDDGHPFPRVIKQPRLPAGALTLGVADRGPDVSRPSSTPLFLSEPGDHVGRRRVPLVPWPTADDDWFEQGHPRPLPPEIIRSLRQRLTGQQWFDLYRSDPDMANGLHRPDVYYSILGNPSAPPQHGKSTSHPSALPNQVSPSRAGYLGQPRGVLSGSDMQDHLSAPPPQTAPPLSIPDSIGRDSLPPARCDDYGRPMMVMDMGMSDDVLAAGVVETTPGAAAVALAAAAAAADPLHLSTSSSSSSSSAMQYARPALPGAAPMDDGHVGGGRRRRANQDQQPDGPASNLGPPLPSSSESSASSTSSPRPINLRTYEMIANRFKGLQQQQQQHQDRDLDLDLDREHDHGHGREHEANAAAVAVYQPLPPSSWSSSSPAGMSRHDFFIKLYFEHVRQRLAHGGGVGSGAGAGGSSSQDG